MENFITLLYVLGGLFLYTAATLPLAILIGKGIHYGNPIDEE